jgi:2-polyprenyl-3-methyl-5-hydroxy-6-metoxy-1,4-benzoquinol methylase
MSFDYERQTRDAYQDGRVAREYHDLYAAKAGWRNLPARIVAHRERRIIEAFARRVPHRKILDLPAGTGKLAGVFAALGSDVVASDISSSMLRLAEAEYSRIGYKRASFMVNDAIDLSEFRRVQFDLAVCLRLLHRVPPALRKLMLMQFSLIAPYTIVSFGIENIFHKTRRSLRVALFGGRMSTRCFCSMANARAEIEPTFEIVEGAWIAPGLSQELIFLLKSRSWREQPAQ